MACDRAEATSAGGYMELDYNDFHSKSKDNTTGLVSWTKETDFTQQYNLHLNLDPFPNLAITTGVLVTNDLSKSTAGDLYTETSTESVRPSIDVRLRDPLSIYYGEAGYSIQKTTTKESNSATQTLYNEIYNASLGWSPVAFPTLPLPIFGLQATRSNIYDQDRTFENTITDTVQFNTRYNPVRQLDLGYSAIVTKNTDQINQVETDNLLQNARVNYSDGFWQRRILLSTGYIISFNNTETTQQGKGAVSISLFPFVGLSNVTDIPTTDTLSPNPALIDGNLTVSANLNIGSSPSLVGDTKFREMGLDFGVATQVNNLQIWVNQQLASDIANSFAWDIYTSEDNVSWTFSQTIFPAPFGPFLNRFNLNFNTVSTRYIKVATRPLVLTVPGATTPNNQSIFVTEIQAAVTKTAQAASGVTTQVDQLYNLNVSVQIGEGFYFVSSYNAIQSASTANGVETTVRQYTLSTGLNLARHFNIGPGLTAAARFSRDDNVNSAGTSQGQYDYGATLSAVPLKTLRSSLVYGGTTADDGYSANNVTLNVTADLYQGISFSSSATVGSTLSNTGVKSDGDTYLATLGIVPRRDLSFSMTYLKNKSTSYGGTQQFGSSTQLERWDIGTTYRPINAVYLTADIGEVRETGIPNNLSQTYGLNWSPLSSGNLQFNFIYTDGVQSYLNQVERVIGPTLTWQLIPSATLSVSYFITESNSSLQNQNVKNLYVQYKMFL